MLWDQLDALAIAYEMKDDFKSVAYTEWDSFFNSEYQNIGTNWETDWLSLLSITKDRKLQAHTERSHSFPPVFTIMIWVVIQ